MAHTGRATIAAAAAAAPASRVHHPAHPRKEAPAAVPRQAAHSPAFPPLRAAVHHPGAAALPLTSLSSPMPSFGAPIQSRPLQANPSHPLLWNSTASTTTSSVATTPAAVTGGRGAAPSSVPRQARAGSRDNAAGGAVSESAERGLFHTSAHTPSPSSASTPRSSTASLVVLRDGRVQPPPQRTAAAAAGHGSPPVQTPAARADKGRRGVPAVNYNALLQREEEQQQQQQQQRPLEESPTPWGPVADAGVWRPPAAMVGAELRAPPPPLLPPPSATTHAAVVEGPLPPDVRRLIAQSCGAGADGSEAAVDAAEQQARRLISTGRRVKVYREELAAAEEERRDLAATAEQHELVRGVLQTEVDDLTARIQALLQERALCEAQLQAQDDAAARDARKLGEAQERVEVLRQTIDGIVAETMVGRLTLRQQVPGLHIENYY